MIGEGLEILEVLQQPTAVYEIPYTDEEEIERKKLEERLEEIVQDIGMAFTGKEWSC